MWREGCGGRDNIYFQDGTRRNMYLVRYPPALSAYAIGLCCHVQIPPPAYAFRYKATRAVGDVWY
eukprot:2654633-Rhodomonas_salina.1